jgi:vacuolar iron transporter family protein
MQTSIWKGFSFGLTSSIITTLGLIIGLNSTSHSKLVVLGGIIVIAIADSLSDSLAMHISEESESIHTIQQTWSAAFSTFFSKAIFALSFIIPVLMFELNIAIIASIIWGLLVLSLLSFFIAKKEKTNPLNAIFSHLSIAVIVIIVSHYIGILVNLILV